MVWRQIVSPSLAPLFYSLLHGSPEGWPRLTNTDFLDSAKMFCTLEPQDGWEYSRIFYTNLSSTHSFIDLFSYTFTVTFYILTLKYSFTWLLGMKVIFRQSWSYLIEAILPIRRLLYPPKWLIKVWRELRNWSYNVWLRSPECIPWYCYKMRTPCPHRYHHQRR